MVNSNSIVVFSALICTVLCRPAEPVRRSVLLEGLRSKVLETEDQEISHVRSARSVVTNGVRGHIGDLNGEAEKAFNDWCAKYPEFYEPWQKSCSNLANMTLRRYFPELPAVPKFNTTTHAVSYAHGAAKLFDVSSSRVDTLEPCYYLGTDESCKTAHVCSSDSTSEKHELYCEIVHLKNLGLIFGEYVDELGFPAVDFTASTRVLADKMDRALFHLAHLYWLRCVLAEANQSLLAEQP